MGNANSTYLLKTAWTICNKAVQSLPPLNPTQISSTLYCTILLLKHMKIFTIEFLPRYILEVFINMKTL